MAPPERRVQVLSLGLIRTGTASMTEAYRILGYEKVLHGIDTIDDVDYWAKIEQASEGTFKTLPTYHGDPVNWDALFGHYDVVTDVASFFSEQLIAAYPDAKVVLTERNFEKWRPSVDGTIFVTFDTWFSVFLRRIAEPLVGINRMHSSWKMIRGFFQGDTMDECRSNMRRRFDEHNALVRKLVPPERLLEYKVGDGWEPLCEFLGKPVPDVPFPWNNEAAMLNEFIRVKTKETTDKMLGVAIPIGVGVVAIVAAKWFRLI